MQRVLLVFAILAAGCKSEEVTQLETVKREVCACTEVACGEAAMKKLPKADHTTGHREQQLAKDIHNCLARIYDAQRPSTDPDQPGSGSGSDAPKK